MWGRGRPGHHHHHHHRGRPFGRPPFAVGRACHPPPVVVHPPPVVYPPVGPQPPPPAYNSFPVPYVGPISGLVSGSLIEITGYLSPYANRFHINLCRGPGQNEQVDHPLHINPRFDENCVVRNSFLNRNWGHEERHGVMPLTRGASFECRITVNDYGYQIVFNGRHFCDFAHRTPKENVTHINVGGDVQLTNVIKR